MQKKSNKNNILFHYTSIETLLKIIENNETEKICLRATHANFLNDPYEYSLAISLLQTSRIKYEKGNSKEKRLGQNFKKFFSGLGLMFGDPYVLSLSDNKNDLTMWRTYGADGKGVAIGLDKNILDDYLNENTRLLKCRYNKKNITNDLTKYWERNKILITEDGIEGLEPGSLRLITDLSDFCFSFKRGEYKLENEWRLCKNNRDDKNVKFHEHDGVIIPYIEYYFPKEIIKKIIIGPCVNKQITKDSIIMLLKLRKIELEKGSIITSKVPYRKI